MPGNIWELGLFNGTNHPNLPESQWVPGNWGRTGCPTGGLDFKCIIQLTLSDNIWCEYNPNLGMKLKPISTKHTCPPLQREFWDEWYFKSITNESLLKLRSSPKTVGWSLPASPRTIFNGRKLLEFKVRLNVPLSLCFPDHAYNWEKKFTEGLTI